jgi:hypothetical protein
MDVKVELNQQEADRQARALAALLVDSPQTRKRIRKVIQKEIIKARNTTARDTKSAVPNDPRKAWTAVKYSVWKKVLGGSISILSRRKAGDRYELVREKTLNPSRPGGNRRPRSSRTKDLQTYYGRDRGFILRFLNAGTDSRNFSFTPNGNRAKVNKGSHGGDVSKYGKTVNTGARGQIIGRQFFEASASTTLDIAAERIGQLIDAELAAAFAAEQQG